MNEIKEIYEESVAVEHDEFSEKLHIPKKNLWKEYANVNIDRKQEDKDVVKFQKTGNMDLLEQLYKNRIPTLKTWVAKHYYPGLAISQDDLFEDLSVVFVKAAQKYQKGRGNFNTCLFTFLLNRIKNIKNGMHAKKRVSEFYDGPRSGMVLSLDYAYSEKEGSQMSLKDIIPDNNANQKTLHIDETVNVLSEGNKVVKEFLYKVSNGESVSNLLKMSKERKMKFRIKTKTLNRIKANGKKAIIDFINSHRLFDQDYHLIEYNINKLELSFKVQLKKTKEYEIISRAIRNFKKNKTFYIEKIKN